MFTFGDESSVSDYLANYPKCPWDGKSLMRVSDSLLKDADPMHIVHQKAPLKMPPPHTTLSTAPFWASSSAALAP
jgi:hypothetical protein